MKELNKIVGNFKESIFSTMTKMALANQAINLSQGFPDFDGPKSVIELAQKQLLLGMNQYASSMGALPLRVAISKKYARHYGLNFNPENQILISNGATEGIFCTLMALLNPGDEVIVLEPFYDSYGASIEMAGGKIVPVTLKKPNFNYDIEELKNAITSKTKLLILNNPHNPTGKVFTEEEIKEIANLALKHDFYILSDEVYEHLVYENKHMPTALLNEISDRTITISSTGKTFGLTGWKIGWVIANPKIIKCIHNVHQFTSFCVAHPLQLAIADAIDQMDEYLCEFKNSYSYKKDLLVNGLKGLDFKIQDPKGTYFALAFLPEGLNDVDYCKMMIVEKKVAAIPTSAFYLKSNEGEGIIRFCFAKKEETLTKAIENLTKTSK
jgi:aspartate/methionine/tyrosine aminotransferase